MFKKMNFTKVRLCLRSAHAARGAPRRWLTATETATALRPFYFAVHPDLFGQFPTERAVNEDSLKNLQQYLENLHRRRRVTSPSLTFYVRDTRVKLQPNSAPSGLKKVQIVLLTRTVRDAVTTVLRSCDLSLEYINEVPRPGNPLAGPRDRPIRWEPSFYSFYGIRNPFAPKQQPKVEDTLRSWLQQNLVKAHKNLSLVEPVRHQTARMVATLRSEVGLASVRWDSSWGPVQFRACLLSLSRLLKQHKAGLNLTGLRVVFTNDQTGLSVHGHILLRSDDVPESWLRTFQLFEHQLGLLAEIPKAEAALSLVLNNVTVVRRLHEISPTAEEYLSQVTRLTASVRRCLTGAGGERRGQLHDLDLSQVSIVVKCATGSLSLSPQDHILVPSACPGFMVIDYLNAKAAHLHTEPMQYYCSWEEQVALLTRATEELQLLSLSRDHNVTWQQTDQCCARLLSNRSDIGVSLEGCRLKVAHFYSVMSDGEIYIPWNWKGGNT